MFVFMEITTLFLLYCQQITDIRDARIDAGLKDISEMTLVQLPGDEPWLAQVFVAETEVNYTGRILLPPIPPVRGILTYYCMLIKVVRNKKIENFNS